MPGSAEILNCDGVSVGYVRVDGKGQQRYRRDRATGKDRVPASQGVQRQFGCGSPQRCTKRLSNARDSKIAPPFPHERPSLAP
jgi:hypothetical protein